MAMTTKATPIVCRAPDCNQVIAMRHESGDVRPVVVEAYVDKRGRLTIRCPACNAKNRYTRDWRIVD